ncbi:hypothetical protein K2173_011717 [Erythroxylum novogranatense]|uniref:Uncharacterized protein n=1 Tax=Erythroxylum novogranatense TaxID=1862640 RepID=A0AAV8TL71_9ROSI|nr:hypothetical protein K2173_011717 [Erythroxylum novogranatense]
MPGSIQISVLEFSGPQLSSPRSGTSVKISLGNREFETRDKGDFSFPLTTLRENLVVLIQDAEGNEISRSDVESSSVIEKGTWDDIFSLEGGWKVHMSLKFILNEEDRQRVRAMRQSALIKKHNELLNNNLRSPEHVSPVHSNSESPLLRSFEVSDSPRSCLNEVLAAQADPGSASDSALFRNRKSGPEDMQGTHHDEIQMDQDRFGDDSSNKTMSGRSKVYLTEVNRWNVAKKTETGTPPIDVLQKATFSEEAFSLETSGSVLSAETKVTAESKGNGAYKFEKQGPREKTLSNVRNMISAFESSMNQEIKSKVRPAPTRSQLSKNKVEVPVESSHLTECKTKNIVKEIPISRSIRNLIHTADVQQFRANIRKREEESTYVRPFAETGSSFKTGNLDFMHKEVDRHKDESSSEVLIRKSTSEGASVSGRIRNPCGNLLLREKTAKGVQPKVSKDSSMDGISGEKGYAFENSGGWIFPDEGRRLCITAGGKQILNLMGDLRGEINNQVEKIDSSVPEPMKKHGDCDNTGAKAEQRGEASKSLSKSNLEGSVDAEAALGPLGQVMRVAIMVGFATLVLFTRQRQTDS